ncbi:MAG TPA: Rieske 2Fe-2S domain-containing protein [Acidimicrobiales bacterium]|nr:Rieske 2Fe-2S domain-containing protein [Acidimicrobiales bacterium]
MSSLSTRSLLGSLDELRAGSLRRFDIAGRHIVVVALGAAFVALDDTCSHESASLTEEGEVDAEAREIECCRHGARFSLDDGTAMSLPATEPLQTYRIVTDGDEVFIEIPEP